MVKKLSHEELEQKVKELEQETVRRKRVEEVLAQSERYYRTLLLSMYENFMVIDRNYRIMDINDTTAQTLGMNREGAIGRYCYEVSHDQDSPCYEHGEQCGMRTVFDTGEVCNLRHERVKFDGRKEYLEIMFSPMKDEVGNITQVVKAERNVTSLFKAQQALWASKDKYHQLLKTINDAAFVHWLEKDYSPGRFIEVNDIACQRLGYTREELLQLTPIAIGSSESATDPAEITDGLKKQGSLLFETTHVTKDGRQIPVESHLRVFDYKGKQAVLSISRDISDRKRIEKTLLERVKELKCLYAISHLIETKNNLSEILQETVNLIPESWQYPEIAISQILLDSETYRTHQLCELLCDDCPHAFISQPIIINGYPSGEIRVCYTEKKLEAYEGPFLLEERSLLNAIAERLGRVVERYRVKKTLCESEEQYRNIYNDAQIGLYRSRLRDGNMVMANNQMAEMFGYKNVEECVAKFVAIEHYVRPETRDKLVESMLEHGKVSDFEAQIKRNDGSIMWLQFSGILSSEEGFFEGVALDITDRKQAEVAMLNSEKKNRAWLESSPVCTKIVDLDFNLQYMSAAGVNGLNIDDITQFYGKPYPFDFYPESFRNLMTTNLKKVKETGKIIEQEGSVVDINGNKLWFHSTLVPVNDDEGRIDYIIVVSTDITERKQAEESLRESEERLQQSQKMESIGTLAGGIAHDFNNILFPIIGHAEMLLDDLPQESPLRNNLDEIYGGSLRARDLVKQILTFSRQTEHEMKPLKVQLVVEEVLKLVRSSLPATISTHHDISNECGLVMADPTQIHQIAMNLCTNAFHAMEETGGKLIVSLQEVELTVADSKDSTMIPGPHVCLTVADTGTGIEQNVKERMFDPYFTTKDEGKGTGLGLAVIHGIIKNHGGHISVYSEPGKGAEFKVYLPVIKPQKTVQQVETDLPIQQGAERILLIDDQDAIVQMIRQMLERLGYHVTARISSPDALEVFRIQPDKFDLVITDMTMPNMTGDKLAGELIKIRSDIPIILCTGFSERMPEEKATSLGIKGFLMKPVVMKDLSAKIREVLDNTEGSGER